MAEKTSAEETSAEETYAEAFAAPTDVEPREAAEAAVEPQPQAQAGEEELMWLGDEFEEAGLEIATQGWRSADASRQPTDPPVLELSDAELSQLAEDEGWDTAEVEAIRSLLGRPTSSPPDQVQAEPTMSQPMTPGPEDTQISSAEATAMDLPESETPSAAPPSEGPSSTPPSARAVRHSMSSMGDPQWLQGRRGPAATAYRRLRRLFPG
jgi:hypothetical protein